MIRFDPRNMVWVMRTRGAKNVVGERLDVCCGARDREAVCARMTQDFLDHLGDKSLQPGQRKCVCPERWRDAQAKGVAPPVVIGATHERALELIDIDELLAHADDVN